VAGGKMKEAGLVHWETPNEGATNSSGYKALPGGIRGGTDGTFNRLGRISYWWSLTEIYTPNNTHARSYGVEYNNTSVNQSYSYGDKRSGFSVRCVKD